MRVWVRMRCGWGVGVRCGGNYSRQLLLFRTRINATYYAKITQTQHLSQINRHQPKRTSHCGPDHSSNKARYGLTTKPQSIHIGCLNDVNHPGARADPARKFISRPLPENVAGDPFHLFAFHLFICLGPCVLPHLSTFFSLSLPLLSPSISVSSLLAHSLILLLRR